MSQSTPFTARNPDLLSLDDDWTCKQITIGGVTVHGCGKKCNSEHGLTVHQRVWCKMRPPKKRKRKPAKRPKGNRRGPLPKWQLGKIPDFENIGHRPVGSIADALQPYRQFYSRKPAAKIAIEAAAKVARDQRYSHYNEVVLGWFQVPKHDREKVLCLDWIVETLGIDLREFISVIRMYLQSELLERARDEQFVAMPEIVKMSVQRAMSPRASTPVVKEALAHMQQHHIVPAPPNAPTVQIQTNVDSRHQEAKFELPSPEEFAKRLDEAARAGREALPPADLSNVIDAETIQTVEKETVAA